jgi:hypothetical protein
MAQLTKRLDRNILRYLYADGLNEIGLGLFFLGMFAIQWLEASTDLPGAVSLILPLLNAAAFIFLMRVVVERLRERITYPRLGYARYKPRNQDRRVLIAVIVAFLAGLTLQVTMAQQASLIDLSTMINIGGPPTMGVCWIWAGYTSGYVRFYALGGMTMALPIVATPLGIPALLYFFPTFIVLQAALMIVFGAWALLKLLRTPVLETENDDV